MGQVYTDLTALLANASNGSQIAEAELLQVLYAELRKLAASQMQRERPGHTLQPTALVHEAWLRLGGGEERQDWKSRAHFFGAAAEAMRRILVESARRKNALKHGGGLERIDCEWAEIASDLDHDEILAVHDALDELSLLDAEKAELVKLRYFVGLTFDEAAALLQISPRTAKRHWVFAKAWLADRIRRAQSEEPKT
jgi:RNA polymerase sigma factor (TIGR02999 family)